MRSLLNHHSYKYVPELYFHKICLLKYRLGVNRYLLFPLYDEYEEVYQGPHQGQRHQRHRHNRHRQRVDRLVVGAQLSLF